MFLEMYTFCKIDLKECWLYKKGNFSLILFLLNSNAASKKTGQTKEIISIELEDLVATFSSGVLKRAWRSNADKFWSILSPQEQYRRKFNFFFRRMLKNYYKLIVCFQLLQWNKRFYSLLSRKISFRSCKTIKTNDL